MISFFLFSFFLSFSHFLLYLLFFFFFFFFLNLIYSKSKRWHCKFKDCWYPSYPESDAVDMNSKRKCIRRHYQDKHFISLTKKQVTQIIRGELSCIYTDEHVHICSRCNEIFCLISSLRNHRDFECIAEEEEEEEK